MKLGTVTGKKRIFEWWNLSISCHIGLWYLVAPILCKLELELRKAVIWVYNPSKVQSNFWRNQLHSSPSWMGGGGIEDNFVWYNSWITWCIKNKMSLWQIITPACQTSCIQASEDRYHSHMCFLVRGSHQACLRRKTSAWCQLNSLCTEEMTLSESSPPPSTQLAWQVALASYQGQEQFVVCKAPLQETSAHLSCHCKQKTLHLSTTGHLYLSVDPLGVSTSPLLQFFPCQPKTSTVSSKSALLFLICILLCICLNFAPVLLISFCSS